VEIARCARRSTLGNLSRSRLSQTAETEPVRDVGVREVAGDRYRRRVGRIGRFGRGKDPLARSARQGRTPCNPLQSEAAAGESWAEREDLGCPARIGEEGTTARIMVAAIVCVSSPLCEPPLRGSDVGCRGGWDPLPLSPSRARVRSGGRPFRPSRLRHRAQPGDARRTEQVSRRRGRSASSPYLWRHRRRNPQGRSEIDPRPLQPVPL